MSELPTGNPAGAMEIEQAAAIWLEQRVHGPWQEEQQGGFDAWLAQSLAHRVAYIRLEEAWRSADRLIALKIGARSQATAVPPRRMALKASAVAAMLLVAAGVMWNVNFMQSGERTYATAIGEHKRLSLGGGTEIELNTDTVVRVSQTRGVRKVWLDRGEAYFQVAHDENRPFVVMATGHRLIDLGTKFVVREDRSNLHVAVLEGRVHYERLGHKGEPRSGLLSSGEVLIATQGSDSVIRAHREFLADELVWRQGLVKLDNTTLAEAAAQFNRYNRRKLIVSDPDIANLRVVGTFQANNVGAFTSVVQDIFKLRIEDRPSAIVILR